MTFGSDARKKANPPRGRRTLKLIMFALALIVAQASSAQAAVTPDPYNSSGANSGTVSAGSTIEWVHSTSNGGNRLLLVGVSIRCTDGGAAPPVQSVTFGTNSLQFYDGASSADQNLRIELWYLIAPPGSTTDNVTVTLFSNGQAVGGSASFSGVDQTTPLGTFASASGPGPAAALTLATSAGEVAFDTIAVSFLLNTPPAAGPGQTEQWNRVSGASMNDVYGAASTKAASSSSTAMTWTVGLSQQWMQGGASIRPSSATRVDFDGARATITDKGVSLEWRTGYEVDNLGFNVYREQNGRRTRLNPEILAGSALVAGPSIAMTAGRSYDWIDKSAADDVSYWIEDVDLDGRSTWHGPIVANRTDTERKQPPERGRVFLNTASNKIADTSQSPTGPVERTAKPSLITAAQADLQDSLSGQPAVKIFVRREGWYRITRQELIAAGFDAQADPRNLRLFVEGREQPIYVLGESEGRFDSVEFYGIGIANAETDARAYWLTASSRPGLRIERVKGRGSKDASNSFLYTVERRDRINYFAALRNGEEENFFGQVVTKAALEQLIVLSHLDKTATADALLEVALQGVTTQPHRVMVELNGAQIGETSFTGQTGRVARFNISNALLREGENRVRLSAQAGESDVSLVDYIRVSYWRGYTADKNGLRFTLAKKQRVTIGGFTSAGIRVMDVTNPEAAREVAAQVERRANDFSVTVSAPKSSGGIFYAFAEEAVTRPTELIANQPSRLKEAEGSDLVIITRREFLSGVEDLKRHRQSQGLRVVVVDVEDAYDEFSFGNKSAKAIKDFLSYAARDWKRAPRFVLMAGDASYDPKNYLGRGQFDLVPTRLIDTAYFEGASDDWFADFNDDGLPEMAVGRLPARSLDELSKMAAKIIRYDESAPSNEVLFVSDSADVSDFAGASARLRGLVPDGLIATEIDRDRAGAATRSLLLDGLNRGPKIVNYTGHGSLDLWRGNTLTSADAAVSINNESLSLFVMMTCLNGYFQDAGLDSLAESLMKAGRAAVAVWASGAMCEPEGQALLNQEFYRLVFGGGLTVGEAAAKAKAAVADTDIRRTWILFGDPTMRLK